MVSDKEVETIKDLEKLYYESTGISDFPSSSETVGKYGPIYGAKVWSYLNNASPIFKTLEKEVWKYSGFRVVVPSKTVTTDGNKMRFASLDVRPSTFAHQFTWSKEQEKNDPSILGILREQFARHHVEMLNIQLWDGINFNSAPHSLNHLISSRSEVQSSLEGGCGFGDGQKLYPIQYGGEEVFVDRLKLTNSWADSLVYHNKGIPRVLTKEMLRSALLNQWESAGSPKLIFTVDELVPTVKEFVADEKLELEKGVVSVGSGKHHTPLVFMLDTDYISLRIAKPSQYFEAGPSVGDHDMNEIQSTGMYRTVLNTVVRFFSPQVKIRDLVI